MTRRGPSWDDPRYALGERLGEGAVGVVHAAVEVATGRAVAIKWLRPDVVHPGRVERFQREGQALAGLSHAGIVRVHGSGVAAGRPFLVMELVPGGKTLAAALAGAPLRRRVALVRDVARALGHAHRQGLVHRDVKPDNVLVDPSGAPRVADFGLALGVDQERLTKTGAVLGTPTHMAPEQWEGSDVGPPADVWSLGVILYEALTGRSPYEAETFAELVAALRRPPLRPSRRAPGLPTALEAACLAALERDPARRPPDGEALAARLDAWLDGRADPRAGRAPGALAAAAAMALLALGGAWRVQRAQAPAPGAGGSSAAAVATLRGAPAATSTAAAPAAPPATTPVARAERLTDLPVPPEGTVARAAYELAVTVGELRACSQLSRCYETGEGGVARDLGLARRWLECAARLGHIPSVSNLILFLDRVHLSDPPRRAELLAQLRAAIDDPATSADLRGVAAATFAENAPLQDEEREALFEQALALGERRALRNLAVFVQPRDPTRALALLRQAVAEDDTGWGELGKALEEGLGAPVDLVEAATCYQRGAKRGDDYCELQLGRCLARGIGVARDPAAARPLLERFTQHGDFGLEARELLASLGP